MGKVSFVYPNVCEIYQRGGLLERWTRAVDLHCTHIEVPADLIKGGDEEKRTGLKVGDFLSPEAIKILYRTDKSIPEELKYILHSEPSLVRKNRFGVCYQPELRWHGKKWTEKFVNTLIMISKFLTKSPAIIEIHPGDRRNTYGNIVNSAKLLIDEFSEQLGRAPLVLLENRTQQFISKGKEIRSFWRFVCDCHPDLREKIGVVLDVQQLYTAAKRDFLKELGEIPVESLKGFHIHSKHGLPTPSDKIPWNQVFDTIRKIQTDIIVNPEIHHANKVKGTIDFCRNMLCTHGLLNNI